jgi:hypothetical protein
MAEEPDQPDESSQEEETATDPAVDEEESKAQERDPLSDY